MSVLLITGAGGFLGSELVALGKSRYTVKAAVHKAPARDSSVESFRGDLVEPDTAGRLLRDAKPDWVIHTAAMTDVDGCERNPDAAFRTNVAATRNLADAAADSGIGLLYISTDQVFDGTRGGYSPEDLPSPINVYGRTKEEAELAVLERGMTVIRTNFFGRSRTSKPSFSDWILAGLRQGNRLPMWTDVHFSPIYIRDLATVLFDLLDRGLAGLFHAGGPERTSKFEFAVSLARKADLDLTRVVPSTLQEAKLAAPRPADMSLDSTATYRALNMKPESLEAQISRLLKEEHR